MKHLYILIDTTTRGTKKSRYGESTACWCAFKDKITGRPFRAGFIYNEYDGPNKIFYEGIIRALEICLSIYLRDCTVIVKGDNLFVINQLKQKIGHRELERYYNQVKALEFKYVDSRKGKIQYGYINEQNEVYKKVDRCSKEFDNFLKQRFNQTKRIKKSARGGQQC